MSLGLLWTEMKLQTLSIPMRGYEISVLGLDKPERIVIYPHEGL